MINRQMIRTISASALHLAMALSVGPMGAALAIGQGEDAPPNTGGRSGGSRGCAIDGAIATQGLPALILLAPAQPYARAASTTPTFAWYVRDQGQWPTIFRLYEYSLLTQDARLVFEVDGHALESRGGINVLQWSNAKSDIAPDSYYLWQIELVCDPSRPSANPFAEAILEVVAPESQPLAMDDQTPLEQAQHYLDEGLWYDALEMVFVNSNLGPEASPFAPLRSLMINQVALTEAERQELNTTAIHQVDN